MKKLSLYLETSLPAPRLRQAGVWNYFFADDTPEKRDITKEFFTKIEIINNEYC
jgi:hypothetical protein